jgi:hypothetical protein
MSRHCFVIFSNAPLHMLVHEAVDGVFTLVALAPLYAKGGMPETTATLQKKSK